MPAEIQVSLFDWLDEVAVVAEANEKEKDPDKHSLNLHKIQENLDKFTENFFIQLFEAFGLSIDFISEETKSDIANYFSDYDGESPENVLSIFEEVFEVVEEMDDDVYFESPEAEEKIYYAYFTFLPRFFDTLKKDESALQKQISNFGAVKVRMEGILVKIGAVKKQLSLT